VDTAGLLAKVDIAGVALETLACMTGDQALFEIARTVFFHARNATGWRS
jgi:hypothetical protein